MFLNLENLVLKFFILAEDNGRQSKTVENNEKTTTFNRILPFPNHNFLYIELRLTVSFFSFSC